MPTPGDQHKESEDILKSGWTKEDINAIQNRLWKNLGPEFIAYRPAPGGGRVPYLEGWKAINLANDTFGFNGWQSEIKLLNVDYCDEMSSGRLSIGISCVVRVTLKDGSFHEDVGFGHAENVKAKYMAFDKCKKEATTDGLKRALRKFGHALGNLLPPPIPSAPSVSRRASTGGDILDPDSFYKFVEDAAAEHDRLYDDLVIDDLMTDDPIFDDDDMDFDEPSAGKVRNSVPPQGYTNPTANTANDSNNMSKINLSTEPPNQNLLSGSNTSKNLSSEPPKQPPPPGVNINKALPNETSKQAPPPGVTVTKNSLADSLTKISVPAPVSVNQNKVSTEPSETVSSLSLKQTPPTNTTPEFNSQPGPPVEPEVINTPIQFFHGSAAILIQKNEPVAPELSFNPSFQSPEIRKTLQHNKSVPIKRTEVMKTLPPPNGASVSPSSNFSSSTNKTAPPSSNKNSNSTRSSPVSSVPTNTNSSFNILNKPNANTAPKFSNPSAKAFGAPRRPIARPVPAKRPMADLGKSQINIPPVTEVPADKKQKVDE